MSLPLIVMNLARNYLFESNQKIKNFIIFTRNLSLQREQRKRHN